MRDWSEVVDAELVALGLEGGREEEIRAELAGHLEDAYADALQRGRTEEDAVGRALEQVPDWKHLADVIHHAAQEGELMTRDARTLLLPGMITLFCAGAVLLGVSSLVPGSLWADPRAPLPMAALFLLSYLAFGALGASWSRRAGGSVRARFFAGTFPLLLHVSMFVTVVVAAMFGRRFPEHLQINFQLRVALIFIVIPGIALTLGTLPFLRNGVKTPAA